MDNSKRVALVKWEECCKPFNHGELGMRKPKEHNMLFLMKLGFKILNNENALWV